MGVGVMSRFHALLRKRGVQVLGVLLLLVVVLGLVSFSVTHFADTLTLTVESVPNSAGQPPDAIIFARTYHDESLVRQIQGEINGIPMTSPFTSPGYDQGGTNPTYIYTFHFTWLGLPVQDASTTSQDGYPWTLSIFGMSIGFIPRVADFGFLVRLSRLTGMPIRRPAGGGS
jgi:hypothetical protein